MSPAECRFHRRLYGCPAVPPDGQKEQHVHQYEQRRIDSAAVGVLVGQVGLDDQCQEVGEEDHETPLPRDWTREESVNAAKAEHRGTLLVWLWCWRKGCRLLELQWCFTG